MYKNCWQLFLNCVFFKYLRFIGKKVIGRSQKKNSPPITIEKLILAQHGIYRYMFLMPCMYKYFYKINFNRLLSRFLLIIII